MKRISILFITYCLFTGGVLYSAFLDRFQPEETTVENRELKTLKAFIMKDGNWNSFQTGSFQNQFQRLVNDQFPMRNTFLKVKLKLEALHSSLIAEMVGNNERPILFKNGDFYQINNTGYYVSAPLSSNETRDQLFENRLWNFEEIYKKYGNEIKLYIYKPTLADETDWFDETFIYPSEGERFFLRMKDQLENKYRVQEQDFDSIEDYMLQHFKTDHHWNDLGAYQGYSDIITMIQQDFPSIADPYPIRSRSCYAFPFYGSLSMKTMGIYGSDQFCDYQLEEDNKIEVWVDGLEQKPGLEEKILLEDLDDIYIYEAYHGTNYSLIEYTNHSIPDGLSILILADSFSNSINDDLALHFKNTTIVDPRAWTTEEDPMNTHFSLDEFIATHKVDIILWLQYYESLYFDSRMYMHIDLQY